MNEIRNGMVSTNDQSCQVDTNKHGDHKEWKHRH